MIILKMDVIIVSSWKWFAKLPWGSIPLTMLYFILSFTMEQWTSSKLGKEYVKTIYCNPVYLIYMQSTSSEMPGGWSTSWNQDAGRNIYNFRYIDDTTLLASRPQGISRQNSASTSPGAGDPSPGLLPEHSLLVPKHPQQCTVDPEGVSLDVVFVWCFRGEK